MPLVSLLSNRPATIYYTLNGPEPTTASDIYVAPLDINESADLKYFGIDEYGIETDVIIDAYNIIDPHWIDIKQFVSFSSGELSGTDIISDHRPWLEYNTIYMYTDNQEPSTLHGLRPSKFRMTFTGGLPHDLPDAEIYIDIYGRTAPGPYRYFLQEHILSPDGIFSKKVYDLTEYDEDIDWIDIYQFVDQETIINSPGNELESIEGADSAAGNQFNKSTSGTVTVTLGASWQASVRNFSFVAGNSGTNYIPSSVIFYNVNDEVLFIQTGGFIKGYNYYYPPDGEILHKIDFIFDNEVAGRIISNMTYRKSDGYDAIVMSGLEFYVPDITTPPSVSADVVGGSYGAPQTVSLSSTMAGNIWYTLDGSPATTASNLYTDPLPISADTTLRFFAIDNFFGHQSLEVTENYTFVSAAWYDVTTPVWANDGAILTQWDGSKYYQAGGGDRGVMRLIVPGGTPTFTKIRVTRSGESIWGAADALSVSLALGGGNIIAYNPATEPVVTLDVLANVVPGDWFNLGGSDYINKIEIWY